ncbi:MAG: hypothetical protein HOE90_02690 [Bacteriovoracaceae bacterium]|nr:hypothetical protein [Bacteriovoracaceae bacterium]
MEDKDTFRVHLRKVIELKKENYRALKTPKHKALLILHEILHYAYPEVTKNYGDGHFLISNLIKNLSLVYDYFKPQSDKKIKDIPVEARTASLSLYKIVNRFVSGYDDYNKYVSSGGGVTDSKEIAENNFLSVGTIVFGSTKRQNNFEGNDIYFSTLFISQSSGYNDSGTHYSEHKVEANEFYYSNMSLSTGLMIDEEKTKDCQNNKFTNVTASVRCRGGNNIFRDVTVPYPGHVGLYSDNDVSNLKVKFGLRIDLDQSRIRNATFEFKNVNDLELSNSTFYDSGLKSDRDWSNLKIIDSEIMNSTIDGNFNFESATVTNSKLTARRDAYHITIGFQLNSSNLIFGKGSHEVIGMPSQKISHLNLDLDTKELVIDPKLTAVEFEKDKFFKATSFNPFYDIKVKITKSGKLKRAKEIVK